MKIERFVKEYAAHVLREMRENEFIPAEMRERAEMDVKRAVHARERGIITVDETLRVIMAASRFRNTI